MVFNFHMRHFPAIIAILEICKLKLIVVRLLRPNHTLQTLLGQRMDDAAVGLETTLDLTLHPHDETGVHSYIIVFGAADFVGHLEFGGGAADVGFG